MLKKLAKYLQYKQLQMGKFSSLESSDTHWSAGQKRFIEIAFSDFDKNLFILDLACGDGVGLREFRQLGFINLTGVEFNPTKIALAKKVGYPVIKSDMHNLVGVAGKFDIIYSSHTLEHSLYPSKALKQFYLHLKNEGLLYIVIPYPDIKIASLDAHVARSIIGSNHYDDVRALAKYFLNHGFTLVDKFYDTFREPEVWLIFKKNSSKKTLQFTKFYNKMNDPGLVRAFYLNASYNNQKKSLP